MRYHIDTIPVWDALKLDGECLLCSLARKTELGEADRYLGASVMEPDIRIQVNARGFCKKHHAMLYGMSNRLGHALMLESHNAEMKSKVLQQCKSLEKAADSFAALSLGRLTRNGAALKKQMDEAIAALKELGSTCLMCKSIEENMRRYYHTFFPLYQNDAEFRKRFLSGKGVCVPHLAELFSVAQEELSAKEASEFIRQITQLEQDNLERMQEDISWFIKKFDYRYDSEPWKNSKDAVPRTVNKLRGWCLGEEPLPKE